jgi:hypothetical protein
MTEKISAREVLDARTAEETRRRKSGPRRESEY